MGIASKVREFFWPLLEPQKKNDFEQFKIENLTVEENDLDKCYDLALRYYDSEDERKKTVESKSTIFISAIGFVIAILLSIATGLLLNPQVKPSLLTSFSIFMWIIIVVYFCRTALFSLRALERQAYHTISHKDFTTGGKDYRKNLITDIINKTSKNSRTINLKVDNMVMAQEYFKRGIVAAIAYSLVLGVYGLIFKTSWGYKITINELFTVLSSNWFPFLNTVCLFINLAIFLWLRFKTGKRNNG